jgi:signal transduction histidine kinase
MRPAFVLSLGFGGLIAFIIAASIIALVQLDRVRTDDARIRKAFLTRLESLEQIRSQIYLSGTYIRDYLLSPDASGAAAQRDRLAQIETQTRAMLDTYARQLDTAEGEPFGALQAEIDDYWKVLQTTFQWTPDERERLRYTFFYEQLVPRRTTMLQIADAIAGINERGLNRAEDQLGRSAGNLRQSLLATFGIACLGGLGLALATIALTLRLERELESRFEESAQARSDLQQLSAKLVRAQEDERRSLARELHDEIGQSLSGILMEAGNAENARDPLDLRDRLRAIGAIAERTLNQVRDLALLLRPSMLDDFGLLPALNWQAREVSKRTGLNIAIDADAACDDLPDEHRTCIYRAVQEAMNNAARHAQARSVRVIVRREAGKVGFSVQDDGCGFDARYTRGLGLLGMEERVRRLGGTLRIDSQPGRGATVSAELPVAAIEPPATYADSHSAG